MVIVMKMKEKKAEVRRKIINAAVELMSDDGFKNVSMRKIAKAAEVGDATIYNYFPNKEKILYGYFECIVEDTIEELNQTPDFHEYKLNEKVQLFLETHLSLLLSNREFVEEAFELAFLSPLVNLALCPQLKIKFRKRLKGICMLLMKMRSWFLSQAAAFFHHYFGTTT